MSANKDTENNYNENSLFTLRQLHTAYLCGLFEGRQRTLLKDNQNFKHTDFFKFLKESLELRAFINY